MQTLDDFGWPLETVQQMLFLRTHAYFLHYKGDNELEPSSRAPTKLYPRPIFTSNTTNESIRFELSELPTQSHGVCFFGTKCVRAYDPVVMGTLSLSSCYLMEEMSSLLGEILLASL